MSASFDPVGAWCSSHTRTSGDDQVTVGNATRVEQAILEERLAELDRDIDKLLSTAAERRVALVKDLGQKYGPTVVAALLKTLT